MYFEGQGVLQDYVKSYMWFKLSEKDGEKLSVGLCEILDENMTPAQIAEAQKLAREWKPRGK